MNWQKNNGNEQKRCCRPKGRESEAVHGKMTGVCWMECSGLPGAQWRELPEVYGPWQSLYARFEKRTEHKTAYNRGWLGESDRVSAVSGRRLRFHSCHRDIGTNWDQWQQRIGRSSLWSWENSCLYLRTWDQRVIPPQSNVFQPWLADWWPYEEGHLVECFFQKFKWFHRIAVRCDKLDTSFLAFVYLASITILSIFSCFSKQVLNCPQGSIQVYTALITVLLVDLRPVKSKIVSAWVRRKWQPK